MWPTGGRLGPMAPTRSVRKSRRTKPIWRKFEAELAYGEPADEIIKWVENKGCDLVAMSTHGHRFIADLFLGSTSRHVRHTVKVPVLLLKAK